MEVQTFSKCYTIILNIVGINQIQLFHCKVIYHIFINSLYCLFDTDFVISKLLDDIET